ncbi:neutral alpha-glucosidase AB [Schistocerca cancellata]|uniref:neutral alpha-glucosidase AB n=1 Tax=Schistocerca cancellata TaxID=274614 RepID=UPI002118B584|nr:neutral alpha-glucosidase AB [Schistocerca cancellata]
MWRRVLHLHLVFLILLSSSLGVDRGNFKACQQSSFCKRCRAVEPDKSVYVLHLNTLKIEDSVVSAEIQNTQNLVKFKFELFSLSDATFRMKINELSPLKPRYEVEHVLVGEPQLERLEVKERAAEYVIVSSGNIKAKIYGTPFRVDFYHGDSLAITANAKGLMKFEHIRIKPESKDDGSEQPDNQVNDDTASDPGAWEENFKSHHDSKPNGPTAVALDFTFAGAHYAYGIPLHADSFALKSTKNGDPYRLFNLDVFEYELNNPMALYGSIPMLVAHGPSITSGVFWLNAAETWVDIEGTHDQNVMSSIVNFVSGSVRTPEVNAHFMSESGIIDVFFMLGPEPKNVLQQYAKLTGTTPLPPYFAIGYHQSRWNYNDQDDVRNVDAKFDEYNLPMDVMWLDIEHTDNKKYFTWDSRRFSQPAEMINNLTAKGRKLVAIVDPHVKRDNSYFLHNDAENNDFYIKNKDGKIYEGWCWPGSSSYPDFFNPAVRDYYKTRYLLENYHGSTLDMHIWNDMNEPSVFNGPEVTIPKDVLHFGGWENRDVHNQYGFMYTIATYEGLMARSNGKFRPFILTRAFFAGSQRYTAMWTGDNTADWGHLKISIPMCLSVSVAGYPFCGADIGGFFNNPNSELITRWYQAGAFQPFFRSHSHIDTKRREPWLFDDAALHHIREALNKRYALLPYIYTLFFEHEISGLPVMWPLWLEFPSETAVFSVDDEYLLGDSLLVHPVTSPGATEVTVYHPGVSEIWYDVDTYQKFEGGKHTKIPVTIDKIPVYQRGGKIIPKKERIRRASTLTLNDPFTLYVALNQNKTASGRLYMDDGETFEYKKGAYLYLSLEFAGNKLTSRKIKKEGSFSTKSWLERVVIMGIESGIKSAVVESKGTGKITVNTIYDNNSNVLVVRKPSINMAEEWSILLQ